MCYRANLRLYLASLSVPVGVVYVCYRLARLPYGISPHVIQYSEKSARGDANTARWP